MFRCWMTCVCVSVGLLAACQVDSQTEKESTTQQGLSSYCSAEMPATPYWDGKAPPTAEPGKQIFLAYPDPNVPGEVVAVLADYIDGKLLWAVRTKSSNTGSLLAMLDGAGQIDYTRHPPPPPPPYPPNIDAVLLLEWAAHVAPISQQVTDASTCK